MPPSSDPSGVARRRLCRVPILGGLLLTLGSAALTAQPPGKSPPIDSLLARAVADSNDPVVHYELGLGYWRKKKYDEAEAALLTALALAPEYAEAHLALASIAEGRGEKYWKKLGKAIGSDSVEALLHARFRGFTLAFLLNPLVDPALLPRMSEADAVFFIGPLAIPIRWQVEVGRAVNEMRQGEFAKARARLDKLAEESALDGPGAAPADVYWYRALAAAHLGDFAAAVEDSWTLVQKGLRAEQRESVSHFTIPTNEYRYMLASMLYLGGRYDDALALFRRTLEHDAGLYMSHVQMARIYEANGKWELAIASRRAAMAANPDDAGLMLDLAGTLARAGQPAEAVDLLETASAAAPRDPRAPYLEAVIEESRGHPAAAAAAYRRFLAIAPSRYAEQRREAEAFLVREDGAAWEP